MASQQKYAALIGHTTSGSGLIKILGYVLPMIFGCGISSSQRVVVTVQCVCKLNAGCYEVSLRSYDHLVS